LSILFYRQGYHPTGINQVIDEADIAKASLYKHFDSKTDLLLHYIRDFDERWFAGFADHMEGMTDPKLRLLALFDYRIERQVRVNYGGCALIKVNDEAGASEPEVVALVDQHKKQLKALIAGLVAASGHRALLSNPELTETIYLMAEGGIVAASIFKNADDLRAAKQIIEKLL
jgi:AcrR family transcriptional regulator